MSEPRAQECIIRRRELFDSIQCKESEEARATYEADMVVKLSQAAAAGDDCAGCGWEVPAATAP